MAVLVVVPGEEVLAVHSCGLDWSVPAFLDTELGCQLTELPIS